MNNHVKQIKECDKEYSTWLGEPCSIPPQFNKMDTVFVADSDFVRCDAGSDDVGRGFGPRSHQSSSEAQKTGTYGSALEP